MEYDFVYADLQLQVTFDADGRSPFGQLTDNETKTLQQLLYMTLNAFHFTRAMFAADVAVLQAKLDFQKDLLDSQIDGG